MNKFKKYWLSNTKAENFVILLPIINAFATILTQYFPARSLNPGVIRTMAILAFGVPFLLKYYPKNSFIANIVLLHIVYLLVLCFISSDILYSLNVYLKVFVSYLHLYFGLHFVKNVYFLKRLSISICISLGIYILNFLVSNYLGLGYKSYSDVQNQLSFGVSGVNLAKAIVAIIIMMPIIYLLFKEKLSKNIIKLLIIGGLIFVLFAFKRSALIALPIGFITIFLILPNKIKSLKLFTIIVTLALLLSPIYINQVLDNYNARKDAIQLNDEENMDKQARYHEFIRVLDAFENGSIKHKLFGSDVFADTIFFNTHRMLHTDYMTLLNGSGLIGIILYLLIYLSIINTLRVNKNKFKEGIYIYAYAVGTALVFAMLFYAVSGIIQSIEPRATILLFLGALLGIELKQKKIIQPQQIKASNDEKSNGG